VKIAQQQQQTCRVCGQPDKLNFKVPDDIWRAAVPVSFHNNVVCLYCFDECARENNVDYAASLSALCFAGRSAAFEFSVVRASSRPLDY
jgi:hypothetical protein